RAEGGGLARLGPQRAERRVARLLDVDRYVRAEPCQRHQVIADVVESKDVVALVVDVVERRDVRARVDVDAGVVDGSAERRTAARAERRPEVRVGLRI